MTDACDDSALLLVHQLAEREAQADDADLDSQILIGFPELCRLSGNAGPPTITYALRERPAPVAAMSADDFKKNCQLNAAQSVVVAAKAKVDIEFNKRRSREANDAKNAAHRRYVDGDVYLQSILVATLTAMFIFNLFWF